MTDKAELLYAEGYRDGVRAAHGWLARVLSACALTLVVLAAVTIATAPSAPAVIMLHATPCAGCAWSAVTRR